MYQNDGLTDEEPLTDYMKLLKCDDLKVEFRIYLKGLKDFTKKRQSVSCKEKSSLFTSKDNFKCKITSRIRS